MKKAINEPELILPFLKKQTYILREKFRNKVVGVITKILDLRLPKQKKRIDNLRGEDEFLLIVLDACRYDALKQEADEYFPDKEVKPVFNEARNTFEWGKNVWGEGLYTCKYISGAVPINSNYTEFEENRHSMYDGYVPAEHILNLRDAWQEAWDDELGVAPPEKITEIALEDQADQMVVHYFQPHTPFIGEKRQLGYKEGENALPAQGKPVDHIIWEKVKDGEISRSELWELYVSNLRRVLDSVKKLLEELDHDNVVITSDYGEALGEYGVYAHPENINHPKVRVVPWLEVR